VQKFLGAGVVDDSLGGVVELGGGAISFIRTQFHQNPLIITAALSAAFSSGNPRL
jgi:hypothetical protein